MTKRERLDRLMRAAEYMGPYMSVHYVSVFLGDDESNAYADRMGIRFSTAFIQINEDQATVARQLAVLMYREAVKRGEA